MMFTSLRLTQKILTRTHQNMLVAGTSGSQLLSKMKTPVGAAPLSSLISSVNNQSRPIFSTSSLTYSPDLLTTNQQFFSSVGSIPKGTRQYSNTRDSPRRTSGLKKRSIARNTGQQKDTRVHSSENLLLKSRLGFYTSSLKGNSVIRKGHSWLERKETGKTGSGTARKKFKELARRQKALKTRRPDSILVEGYLPRKEIQLQRSSARIETGNKKHVPWADLKRGLLYANYTKSNFIFTLTDIDGNCLSRISSGSMNLDKFSRKSPFAAEDAARQVSSAAGAKGLQMVDIIFRGKGFQNYRVGSIMKGLQMNNIVARRVKKDLKTPHGGCRQKKARRI
jgi:small subunit ribosomal protein S11